MQIVIDIPDKKYEALKMLESATIGLHLGVVEKAIINGTPLPKGHGRLIDADAMKTIKNIQSANFNAFELIRYWIDNQPTIIEADKEAEDADSN